MLKLSQLIGDYEEPSSITIPNLHKELPISSPKQSKWALHNDPNRLVRMFKFKSDSKLNEFVVDVLEHQAETQHHGRITIQSPKVKIEIWTHTLNDVTDIDFEWCKAVDDIFEGYNE